MSTDSGKMVGSRAVEQLPTRRPHSLDNARNLALSASWRLPYGQHAPLHMQQQSNQGRALGWT